MPRSVDDVAPERFGPCLVEPMHVYVASVVRVRSTGSGSPTTKGGCDGNGGGVLKWSTPCHARSAAPSPPPPFSPPLLLLAFLLTTCYACERQKNDAARFFAPLAEDWSIQIGEA
ncbi:hypothetical protein MTO96_030117 [Rhipicephalus appendiculatus]